MSDKRLTLRLLTPAGAAAEVSCDGVQLTLRENAAGRQGGLVGIEPGHTPAVLALGEGPILALTDHREFFRASASGGFALVKDDAVTVITDSAVIDQAPSGAGSS